MLNIIKQLNIKTNISILLLFICSLQSGFSATKFFEGGNWHEPLNWLGDELPDDVDDVIMLASGSISQSETINNISVGNGQTLTIASGTLTAREIKVFPNGGELINNGTIKLIIDVGRLQVFGMCTNNGTIEFVGMVAVSGSINNSGIITGTLNSFVNVGNGGIFDNFGTIDGTGVNFQINNGIFNNTAIINIDLSEPTDFNITSTGHFSNTGSLITNAHINLTDDAVFENRNIIDIINTESNAISLWLRDESIFRNFVNLHLTQSDTQKNGITVGNDSSFENYGLLIMENAPIQIGTFTNPQFTNFENGEIYISNTNNHGLRISVQNTNAVNHGIISLCQTNLVTGTCPLALNPGTSLINLAGSTLYTGIDIFNGNCSATVVNNISNQGQILASCGTVPNFSCPLNFLGINMITGVVNGPADFETDGIIESDATVTSGTVFFDSGISITLMPNFEVLANTTFTAFIDGCNGL